MGYTTDFTGRFALNKKLSDADKKFLIALNETRRMKRDIEGFGVEGEFYVEDDNENVLNANQPSKTQPGLWCQWRPTDDGLHIEWDGGEKAYCMPQWLVYILNRFLIPRGYLLNGIVHAQGEDDNDIWELKATGETVWRRKKKGKWEAVEYSDAPLLKEAHSIPVSKSKFEIS